MVITVQKINYLNLKTTTQTTNTFFMQKNIYLSLLILLTTITVKAQKPQFLLEAKRSGVSIGEIKIELFPTIAPMHVANFSGLVASQFYDSTAFHRVIPGFMIQGGDPNSRSGPKNTWGYGNPSQPKVDAEFSEVSHTRGILSAARSSDINSATSQFFICVASATNLNGNYSVYGKAYEGMSVVDNIVASPRDANNNPNEKIEMFITYIGNDSTRPEAPTLTFPANNTFNIAYNQSLSWSSVATALLYKVEVARDEDFTDIFFTKNGRTTNVFITNLEDTTTYFWRVTANNGGYLSEASQVFSFSTKVNDVGINKTPESLFTLEQNVPNPFSSITTISYHLTTSQTVSLKILDFLGHEIALLENKTQAPGKHEIVFEGTSLPNGIYYYHFNAGTLAETKKMVVLK
ncbi:MAG: peptidylprolyl isomerase [Bacteroidetes bacterium]|nr:peptidylprolyl isomerase [Bacteroidota bacterium]HET6246039.1 peptidylprolyl isomerase [Bacteroidia bacterium]